MHAEKRANAWAPRAGGGGVARGWHVHTIGTAYETDDQRGPIALAQARDALRRPKGDEVHKKGGICKHTAHPLGCTAETICKTGVLQ